MNTPLRGAAALAALFAAGCVTASGETGQALDQQLAADGFVQELYVSANEGSRISGDFAEALKSEIDEKLQACADGERPLRMDVMLSRVKNANPVISAVMTDTNEIEGHVQVWDLTTGQSVGDYDVTWENRGGLGAIGGLMQTAMGQSQVIGGFAEEICARTFEGEEGERTTLDPLPF